MNEIDQLRYFLCNNEDWEATLTSPPYNLITKRDKGYLLLKYSQINSDFSEKMVQGARGVIFDEENHFEIVCRPFKKFFNFGEELVDSIDWESSVVQEKLDGSILKSWYSERLGEWVLSTNGVIFGQDVPIMYSQQGIETFGNMVGRVKQFNPSKFFRNLTYIFEIVGPNNRVVVPYENIDLYFLSAIETKTGMEYPLEEDMKKYSRPKEFSFDSLDEVVAFSRSPAFNNYKNEGFVVKDKHYHRVKIKTEDYLRIHRIRGEAIPNDKKILELVLMGEQDEFLSYFPEYTEQFITMAKKVNGYQQELVVQVTEMLRLPDEEYSTRKKFADWAKKQKDPAVLFGIHDGKIESLKEWARSLRTEVLLKRLSQVEVDTE